MLQDLSHGNKSFRHQNETSYTSLLSAQTPIPFNIYIYIYIYIYLYIYINRILGRKLRDNLATSTLSLIDGE